MEDISVAKLLIDLLDDENKARILKLISEGYTGDVLLDKILDFQGVE